MSLNRALEIDTAFETVEVDGGVDVVGVESGVTYAEVFTEGEAQDYISFITN